MKRIIAGAIAVVLMGVGTASAHTFTLKQAHRLATGIVQNSRIVGCSWNGERRAICTFSLDQQVLVGGSVSAYRGTLIVTRYGACSLHVTQRTSATSGTASGTDAGFRGCYTGPLVVIPGRLTLG